MAGEGRRRECVITYQPKSARKVLTLIMVGRSAPDGDPRVRCHRCATVVSVRHGRISRHGRDTGDCPASETPVSFMSTVCKVCGSTDYSTWRSDDECGRCRRKHDLVVDMRMRNQGLAPES